MRVRGDSTVYMHVQQSKARLNGQFEKVCFNYLGIILYFVSIDRCFICLMRPKTL